MMFAQSLQNTRSNPSYHFEIEILEASHPCILRYKILEAFHPCILAFCFLDQHQSPRSEFRIEMRRAPECVRVGHCTCGASHEWCTSIMHHKHMHHKYAPQAQAQASSLTFVPPAPSRRRRGPRTSCFFWLWGEKCPKLVCNRWFPPPPENHLFSLPLV